MNPIYLESSKLFFSGSSERYLAAKCARQIDSDSPTYRLLVLQSTFYGFSRFTSEAKLDIFHNLFSNSFYILRSASLREGVNEKKTFSFGHCPNYLNPPTPWPQFRQLGPLFSEVEIQDLKVSLELKKKYIYYIIYCIYAT